jgi:hypothetical protein
LVAYDGEPHFGGKIVPERKLNHREGGVPIAIAVLTLLAALSSLGHYLGALSVAAFVVIFWVFFERLEFGRMPILELVGSISALQWLLAPYLSYTIGGDHPKMHMHVNSEIYFGFALPGTIAFMVALLIPPTKKSQYEPPRVEYKNFRIGVYLVVFGIVAGLVSPRVPGSLRYAVFLVSLTTYVGAFYCLYSNHSQRWWVVILALGVNLIGSIRATMFHDLIILSSLSFLVWASVRQRSRFAKLLVVSIGLCSIITIQLVKQEFRDMENRRIGAFFELVGSQFTGAAPLNTDDSKSATLIRFNQGWIISAVMVNVPDLVPFAGGRTVIDAAKAAFVPRLLVDKRTAGGAELVEEFTGFNIANNTSMGLSLLGEAYANFGKLGGITMLFMAGLIFNRLMMWLRGRVAKDPHFFFWLPFVFYQSIKAETDSLVVMNQLVKGTLMALFLFWLINRYIRPRSKDRPSNSILIRPRTRAGSMQRDRG